MSYAHDLYHNDGGLDDDRWDPGDDLHGRDDDRAPPITPSRDPTIWVSWTGARHKLADMTDLHLARALATSVDKDGVTHVRVKALLAELTRRATPPQEAPRERGCTRVGGDRI